jgi:hypothetical protein
LITLLLLVAVQVVLETMEQVALVVRADLELEQVLA